MRFDIRTNSEQFLSKLKGKEAALGIAVRTSLFRIGNDARNMANGLAPRKTGSLTRSIIMYPTSPTTYVDIGSNLVYARIQDLGGEIRPKSGKYLTIPLPGVRGSIRSHSGGFFIRSKAGNLLYVKKAGNGIKPLFVLKDSVKIKGNRYLSTTFEFFKGGRAREIVGEEVIAVIKSM